MGDGTTRRRRRVLLELLGVVAFCTAGFYLLSEPVRLVEVPLIVWGLHLVGVDAVAALGTNIVLASPEGYLTAAVTPSCSALLAVLALAALAGSVLRGQGWRTVGALIVTSALLVFLNGLRIGASVALGTVLGRSALGLFHDWVGTVANFVFTITGFVIMIWLLLPSPIRAEQDRFGRHTAHRPVQWAQSGLGYRTEVHLKGTHMTTNSPAARLHRLYPRALRERSTRRREADRVDFRVGALEPHARATALRELVSDGLAVHAATLWAAAGHETDPEVLDALADAVAARQWEPTVNDKVGGIRLWARAWLAGRPGVPHVSDGGPEAPQPSGDGLRIMVTGSGGPAGVSVIRRLRQLGYWTVAADADPHSAGETLGDSAVNLPLADDEHYLDVLLAACRDEAVDGVIFTTVEEMAAVDPLAFERARVTIWIPSPGALRSTVDKVRFAKAMAAAGIPHPATTATADGLRDVPGPWIVKPVSGRGSRGVMAIDTESAVRWTLNHRDGYIAQTRLTGREWTCDALIGRDGAPLVAVPRWRDQTRGGISVMGTTFVDQEQIKAVTTLVHATCAAVGITGPACVQGFVDEGTTTIVELNPRFSGGLPLTIASGADVVDAYTRLMLDRHADVGDLTWHRGVRMSRYFAEVFHDRYNRRLADPARSARLGLLRENGFEIPDSDPIGSPAPAARA